MPKQYDLFADSSPNQGKEKLVATRVLYFDLETQKSADDVDGWDNIHRMKLAVGVVWDSIEEEYFTYLEKDTGGLVEKLRSADLVVGFNVIGFDYKVLQPYANIDLQEIPTFDMLIDIKKKLGFRLSLNHLAQQNLNAEKTADGLISLKWWKEGKVDKIIKYCTKDVEVTRDLFLFGANKGYIEYQSKGRGVQKINVEWKIV
tara:strand:- start:2750 stop:3355 length:606 start_codon:yes stop_codon:yes gene_type:complete